MKRGALQTIQSLSGIMVAFSALALLVLIGWAIFDARVSYSWVDDSGGMWTACGSLYADPRWPLYFLPLFGVPALIMTVAIYSFRYCSRQLDGTLCRLDHRANLKNEEADIR